MRPVLLRWRGLTIWSYPALLYIGLVCGFYVLYLIAPEVELNRGRGAVAALILVMPALVGSRLWFVVSHWSFYRHDLRRIWRRSEGGMALYGGLVLSIIFSLAVLAALHVGFAAFWDAATFMMLVGMIFTRVGCLLNGCCAGRENEGLLALYLPDHAGRWARRYPVQLLELATAASLLGGVVALLLVGPPQGVIFAFALTGYSCVRLFLDRWRDASGRSAEGLSADAGRLLSALHVRGGHRLDRARGMKARKIANG
jgi:phosphatidylglycerol:prolipoprotein diacylglycerol transferase